MSKKVDLTRRKVLGGLASIGAASAAAGAGTMAYFSDSETTDSNSVSAGTLDLALADSNPQTAPLAVSDTYPGDSGSATITLTNSGSLSGSNSVLDAKLKNVSGTGGTGGTQHEDGNANLAGNLNLKIWLDTNNSGNYGDNTDGDFNLRSDGSVNDEDGTGYLSQAAASKTLTNYNSTTWNGIHQHSGTEVVYIEWEVPTTVGNTIQGDSVSFDMEFQLRQSDATSETL